MPSSWYDVAMEVVVCVAVGKVVDVLPLLSSKLLLPPWLAAAVAVSPLAPKTAPAKADEGLATRRSDEPVLLAAGSSPAAIDGKSYDVVIVGGTGGGVACAVRTARAVAGVGAGFDPTSGRSQGVRRGLDLLDQLERLRRAIMLGDLTRAQVERLAALVAAQRGRVDDPALAELLNEIEVRAAVELAKVGR